MVFENVQYAARAFESRIRFGQRIFQVAQALAERFRFDLWWRMGLRMSGFRLHSASPYRPCRKRDFVDLSL
jgi:hypothetical protein